MAAANVVPSMLAKKSNNGAKTEEVSSNGEENFSMDVEEQIRSPVLI